MASSAEAVVEARSVEPDTARARATELYEHHGRMVLGLCRVILREPAEAEDAAQQTFLSAYRSLLGGTEPRQPAAWLATIARNECWARARERTREPVSASETERVGDLPDPLDATIRKADLEALWTAIEDLPPQQRDALVMRELSGLSYEELAETLDVTQPAVESLLFRARRELRGRLRPAAAASLVPLLLFRDVLFRLPMMGDPSAGTLAKVGSMPVAAKLAAGAATVGVVAGGVAAVEPELVGRGQQKAAIAARPVYAGPPLAEKRSKPPPWKRSVQAPATRKVVSAPVVSARPERPDRASRAPRAAIARAAAPLARMVTPVAPVRSPAPPASQPTRPSAATTRTEQTRPPQR
jgi:RNA polymerase sigma-70 factor (ECF subfamily)